MGKKKSTKKKINSRAKGAAGERELAGLLREHGYEARRGQQFSGGGDSPDVISSMEGFHHEVKRVQSLNIQKALEQSRNDAKEGDVPLVWHRRNGEEWKVTLSAKDFLQLMDRIFEKEI